MLHLGEFSVGLQGPLLKTGLPIIKNVLKPLINTFLIPLGLTATASSIDAAVWKNFFWIWHDNIYSFEWRNE